MFVGCEFVVFVEVEVDYGEDVCDCSFSKKDALWVGERCSSIEVLRRRFEVLEIGRYRRRPVSTELQMQS